MGKQLMAHPGTESSRRFRCKILGRHRTQKANQAQRHHDQAHLQNITAVSACDSHIYNRRHHQRHNQFKGRLQHLEQRGKNAFFFIIF